MDALALGLCALGALGLFSNGLIFVLLYRKQSMRTFSNRFVLSLAASHLLQCLLVIPAMVASALGVTFPRAWCRATDCLTVCLNLASVFSILLIAVDRNCAVNSPLHYALTITRQRATGLICAAWAAALALSAPRLAFYPRVAYACAVAVVGFCVPFVHVAGLYLAMFRAARDNSARRSSSNSSGSNEVIVNLKKQGVAEYTIRRNFSADRVDSSNKGCLVFVGKHKAAVTGLMVVVSFVSCWTPYFAALVFEACFAPLSDVTLGCVHVAAYTSCVLNPYIYFFRNKNAWKECKKLLKGVFCCCGSKALMDHSRSAKKTTIDMSPSLFRIPTSLSQSVLTMNTTNLSCSEPSRILQTFERAPRGVFSLEPAKPLLHQDSSSSNDSNEACTTSVIMDSGLSMDEDSTIWFHPFQGGMVDVPLRGDDIV